MGNAASVELSASLDIEADKYIATFSAASGASDDDSSEEYVPVKFNVERIQIQAGPEPSYAVVSIPHSNFAEWDEWAFAVALRGDGPLGKIKLRSRAAVHHSCNGAGTQVLSGSVADIAHDVGTDSAVITIADDRWYLSKVTVFGQIQYDPAIPREAFIAGEPCIFNAYGWPNCLDTENGPRFAPSHRYGYLRSDTEEPESGAATSKARSWTIADAIEYLRAAHSGQANLRPSSGINYGNPYLPVFISWPKNLGAQLTVTDTKKDQGGNRQLSGYIAEGQTLLAVLSDLARKAGPFDLFMQVAGQG